MALGQTTPRASGDTDAQETTRETTPIGERRCKPFISLPAS